MMARGGHGSDGTQAQWHHFAEFVRHALHAAADQIEPQADGLEPIRTRILAGAGPNGRQSPGMYVIGPYWTHDPRD